MPHLENTDYFQASMKQWTQFDQVLNYKTNFNKSEPIFSDWAKCNSENSECEEVLEITKKINVT